MPLRLKMGGVGPPSGLAVAPIGRIDLVQSGGGSIFSTSFSGSENPISQSGKWLNGATDGLDWKDMQILSGIACGAAFSSTSPPPYNDAVSVLKASAFACPANCYVQGVVHLAGGYSPPSTHELGLFGRASISANSITGYEWYMGVSGSSTVVRWNGALNDFNGIISVTGNSNPADGDVMRLEFTGNSIKAYQNGNLVANGTDNTFASGQPGLQTYAVTGATFSSYGFSSLEVGPL